MPHELCALVAPDSSIDPRYRTSNDFSLSLSLYIYISCATRLLSRHLFPTAPSTHSASTVPPSRDRLSRSALYYIVKSKSSNLLTTNIYNTHMLGWCMLRSESFDHGSLLSRHHRARLAGQRERPRGVVDGYLHSVLGEMRRPDHDALVVGAVEHHKARCTRSTGRVLCRPLAG